MGKLEFFVFGAIALFFLLIIGLGIAVVIDYSNAPDEGDVVSRHYSEESTTQICTPSGNVTICTPSTSPARWTIRVKNGDAEGPIDVSEETHSLCIEGTRYPQCAQG